MKLNVIPADSHIFIDSNIFTYHLLGHKRYRDSVKDFLIKIESGIYTGYINNVVVSEVYHNFIRVKICDKYNIKPVDFTRFIKSNQEIISEVDMSKVTAILSMKNPPELTAEYNVRLYGAIMGMSKKQREDKFQEIFRTFKFH